MLQLSDWIVGYHSGMTLVVAFCCSIQILLFTQRSGCVRLHFVSKRSCRRKNITKIGNYSQTVSHLQGSQVLLKMFVFFVHAALHLYSQPTLLQGRHRSVIASRQCLSLQGVYSQTVSHSKLHGGLTRPPASAPVEIEIKQIGEGTLRPMAFAPAFVFWCTQRSRETGAPPPLDLTRFNPGLTRRDSI